MLEGYRKNKDFEWNRTLTFPQTTINWLHSSATYTSHKTPILQLVMPKFLFMVLHHDWIWRKIGNFWGYKVIDIDDEGNGFMKILKQEPVPYDEFAKVMKTK